MKQKNANNLFTIFRNYQNGDNENEIYFIIKWLSLQCIALLLSQFKYWQLKRSSNENGNVKSEA